MAKFCTGCGATLADDRKFCTECGTPVNAEEKGASPAEQSAEREAVNKVPDMGTPVPVEIQRKPDAQSSAPVQPAYQNPSDAARPRRRSVQSTQPATPPTPRPTPQINPQPVYQQPVYQQTAPVMPQQPVYGGDAVPAKGSKYEPITAGGYIGIMLLMCIPVIGLILTIIWACGGCRKVNKKSLARAALIMMAVSLVISLILGLVFKGVVNKAMESAGLAEVISGTSDSGTDTKEDEEGLMDFFKAAENAEEKAGKQENSNGSSGTSENTDASELSELSGLLGLLGGLSGSGDSNVTNSDIQELQELEKILEGLGAATGGDTTGLEGLVDGAIEANQDAEKLNDGWPKTLRPYPDGTATAVASYRTEISGSSKETLHQWIEDLKSDGFEYQDFYDFGMTEEDMLNMDSWWGYDGTTYLSVSFYEGLITIDHTKELPDLESYFGG